MGKLTDALAPQSSYAAKKTSLWDDLTDRIAGAIVTGDLAEVELWMELNELLIPWPWREPLRDLIERRREELKAEDIGEIVRDRYDFT